MSDDDGPDIDQLREETSSGDRIAQAESDDDRDALQASIVEQLEAIERGETQPALTVWDEYLAALFGALDADHPEELEALYQDVVDELDAEVDEEVTKTATLRLLLRCAMRDLAPEQLEITREAAAEHATPDL